MSETPGPREPPLELLVAAFDAVEELLFLLGPDGRLRYANESLLAVTGSSGDAVGGTTLASLVATEAVGRVTAAVEQATETGAATVEAPVLTDDGQRAPYRFSLRRLDGGSTLVGVGRNRSGRRYAGREREAVLDRMTSAFFAVDDRWRLTYVNDRARDVLASAMADPPADGDLVGEHLWESIPGATETVFYERYHEAIATQESVSFEEYYEPLDVWFEVNVYPSETGLSVYFTDVTERRRQRETLRSRERLLRRMHDVIADPGRSFEGQVEALLGLGREELDTAYGSLSRVENGEYVFEVVDAEPDDVAAGDAVPLSATNCELAVESEETLVLGDLARDAPALADRPGNQQLGVACYLGAPVFVDNSVYGTLCFYDTGARAEGFSEWEVTLVDLMSRWVSYELERQRANERLQRQNDRLEQFTAVVSHDLRNPLNVLQGSLSLAEESGDSEHFERARRAIDRMDALVEDLLSLARAGDAIDDPGPVDLGALARRCWEGVDTGDATLDVAADRTVLADESRLRQLLENLFRNAVEHGGDVTVTVGGLADGFYVADDGPGIPPDERERVLEGGYSTADGGTGLGLRIVAEVATAHGWELSVGESDGGGARFAVTGVD